MFKAIFAWFGDVLQSIGLLKKNAKIVFLGLDNAGKSTLLNMLRDNRFVRLHPTLSPACEELVMGNIRFQAWDLGGHQTARRLWKGYCYSMDAIVFIVDSADRTRFEEARQELAQLLQDQDLAQVPILVLGNKIDIPTGASEDELRNGIGLYTHMTAGRDVQKRPLVGRPIELFMISVVKRMGYAEAFQWLGKLL